MEEKTKTVELIKSKVIFDTWTLLRFLKDSEWIFTGIDMLHKVIKCSRKQITVTNEEKGNLELELCYGDEKGSYILIHGDSNTCMTSEEFMVFSILKQFDFSEIAGLLVAKL